MAQRFNAFISYAWRNNLPFEEGGTGWVSLFHNRLSKLLDQELPRDLSQERIWLDYEQLRGSDHINSAIRQKLEASRLLVPILSKAYLDSPWCRQELEIFLSIHGPDSGRIFPVWMEPVEDLPPPLGDLLKYKFWYEDAAHKPRTRWFPEIDPTDRDYGRIQQDMARDMAGRLVEIARLDQPAQTPTAPTSPSQPARPNGHHLVLINGGDDDWELVEAVAERLNREHGIGYALPLKAGPGLKSSEINRDLRDKLNLCNAVLLVYHKGPEHQLHRQITEALKSVPKRPKSAPPLSLDLCQPCGSAIRLGFKPPNMRILECSGPTLDDCAQQLAGLLA